MKESDINLLSKRINTQKCVVVLGPHLSTPDDSSVITHLNKSLDQNEDKVKYYEEEDILGIDSKTRNNYIESLVNSFFEGYKPNKVYEQLAEIPFSLVINTSPDKFLVKAMEDKGIKPSFSYYHKGKPLEDYEHNFQLVPESEDEVTTHIFNIFGDYNHHNSMVLTFSDLYEYLDSLINQHPLEEDLKLKIREAKAVLFFGCSFDKWYFQLFFQHFLQIMKVKEDDVLNSNKIDQPNTKNFIMNEFHMEFFENDAAGAIKALYDEVKSGKITREIDDSFDGPPPKVFISYKWGGDSEKLANELKDTLTDKGLDVKIDKEVLPYKADIQQFEKHIGQADIILVVLSDDYLKAEHCMFELSEIYRNDDFTERIFPLALKDAKTFKSKDLSVYKDFWNDRIKEIGIEISKDVTKMATYMDDLNTFNQIHEDFDKMTGALRKLNLGDVDEHRKTKFQDIIKDIKKLHRIRLSEV
ncbi:toll/interleukin-1 receptor domain-containing protein [Muriicola sp. Z0-33]|uniref:toll/interleukin-1 receptor domain-containing protein n=1 Tax=Muriicola sp. Z0-33 TaxID=2816957 RepID=UPI002238016A|nr:toll/interleukin-1 receptor domain-containing protein [Muriicola sp. Z0-33]MCW5516483.1 toll/interleukin-1 receptor domain-containing protein [Muriicola sp. Z0-33]